MKEIVLTNGLIAKVDDDDFEWLSQYKWGPTNGYAMRSEIIKIAGKQKTKGIMMHREINKTPVGKETDHIDGDRLNNQKSNLRTATASENQANYGLPKNNKTGYRGVFFHQNRYCAVIRHKNKLYRLGRYKVPEEAALAYNKAAIEKFGEFAYQNTISVGQTT